MSTLMTGQRIIGDLTNGYFTDAVTDRLVSDLKTALRQRIMPQLEAEVDAIVDEIVAGLAPQVKTAVHRSYDRWAMDMALEVKTHHLKVAS